MKQDHPKLSIRRQCTLLSLTRSTLYYQPRGESAENLKFMSIIDKQFLQTPWYGSRQMARHMQREGHRCGRHRVRRLMRLMRWRPIDQKPDTSKPDTGKLGKEIGGAPGPEPTRYGDWQFKGRVTDF